MFTRVQMYRSETTVCIFHTGFLRGGTLNQYWIKQFKKTNSSNLFSPGRIDPWSEHDKMSILHLTLAWCVFSDHPTASWGRWLCFVHRLQIGGKKKSFKPLEHLQVTTCWGKQRGVCQSSTLIPRALELYVQESRAVKCSGVHIHLGYVVYIGGEKNSW